MALKQRKKEKVIVDKVKKKTRRRPNWILRITILIVAIPVLVLAFVLLTSIEKKGEPVEGDRFEKHLNPKIKNNSLKTIESALKYDNVDSVKINLISATLRISIDTHDGLDAATIEAIANDAYAKVNEVIPVDTYFSNHDDVKMYDLEINVYNLIPSEGNQTPQIWCVKHKNASEGEVGTDWLTTAKNQGVADEVRKPANIVPKPVEEGQ